MWTSAIARDTAALRLDHIEDGVSEAVAHDDPIVGLFGAGGSVRIPWNAWPAIAGPAAVATGTENIVAMGFNPTFTGDFTGISGSDPGHAWGMNLFTALETDAASLTAVNGGLIEVAVKTASGTLNVGRGLEVGVSLYGAAAGATITQAESLRVTAPVRKGGATGGAITNAYCLFVEDVGTIASSSKFSLYVEGGISRFNGRVDTSGNISNANTGATDHSIYAGFTDADGARLQLIKAGSGGHFRARLTTASSEFQVSNGGTATWACGLDGIPKWTAAANAQTTVGAPGGATALPATPTTYLKVKNSDGTTLVVPAYAAA